MDELPEMARWRNALEGQHLEAFSDLITCCRLIYAIEQRLRLIHDLRLGSPNALAYWVSARPEIEWLAENEAAARKAYHRAVGAGLSEHPATRDLFPILRDALDNIAGSLGHAFATCAKAAAAQPSNTREAFRDQSSRRHEDQSS